MRRLLVAALAVVLAAGSTQAGVISATNNTGGNFDSSSGTRSVSFTGLEPGFDSGIVDGVTISINFAKADGQNEFPPYPGGTPFYNEIVFRLTSPNGTTVTLIGASSWGSGSGQFDGTITFDDSALQVVNFGAAPVPGTFRPTGPGTLADFLGENAGGGNWTLFIQDTVAADSLRFREFTLNLTTLNIPEPMSMVVFGGLTVAGVVGIRRRVRKA